MRPLYPIVFLLLLTPAFAGAQAISINTDSSNPDPSAILDVKSADKGVLVPRMNKTQRELIAAPATGLLVFDTDLGGFWFYNGAAWISLSAGTATVIADTDADTKIQMEENPDEDVLRVDLAGSERLVLKRNANAKTLLELPNNSNNILVGTGAGNAMNTGAGNVAIGSAALNANTTGYSNTALGIRALYSNTDRSNLVAVGDSALHNNGIGVTFSYEASGNTALGSKALYANTVGFENTASGWQALFSNTFGDQNTANGKAALQDNTTGDGNTASGWEALSSNTTGGGNTATGRAALQNNTGGTSNTAIGSSALNFNTTGSLHTAIGSATLTTSSTGSRNTALGAEANIGFGNLSNATAIGAKAFVDASNCLVLGSINGVNYATESVNVGIGTTTPDVRLQVVGGTDISPSDGGYIQSGPSGGLNIGMDDNEIMARNNGAVSGLFLNNSGGNVKIGNASSRVGLGRTASTNTLEVEGAASKSSAGSWVANSDARLKKNIAPLNSHEMLDRLLALQGVTYEWNDDKTGSARPEGVQYGFTAQNIQTVFPTLVEEDKLGFLQTAYGTYDAMTVEAIRALHNEIGVLKSENAALKAQLDKITAALQTAGIGVAN
ncbi:MAG: tail fiber domain-containing protein [Lewinellaceae bacterium]|nr:tail fiber domain-containing protein [Lewinellaceae bacterium]